MKISKEMYESHRALSECSAHFLEFIETNPEITDRSNFNDILSDKAFAYYRNQPWPTFISSRTRSMMEEAAIKVYKLFTDVPERLFNFDSGEISRYYNIPEDEAIIMLYGVNSLHMSGLLGRGDFAINSSGDLKCLEFNMSASLGGWGKDFQEPIFLNTGIIAEFLKKYNVRVRKSNLFETLLGRLAERSLEQFGKAPDFRGEVNIAIAFAEFDESYYEGLNVMIGNIYKQLIGQIKNGLKGDVILCDLKRLHLKPEDKALWIGGKRIHSLIEMSYGEIPIMFMELVKNGELLIHNGPITPLISNKFNLAALSENRDSGVFTPEERADIQKYIPWTRRLVPGETTYEEGKVRMEDFVISNRERLVIKPSQGFAGKGVFLGANTLPDSWKEEVDSALRGRDRVVQEYVPPTSYMFQSGEKGCYYCKTVFGFFIFASRFAGGFARMIPFAENKGVINAALGAEEGIVIEVEE